MSGGKSGDRAGRGQHISWLIRGRLRRGRVRLCGRSGGRVGRGGGLYYRTGNFGQFKRVFNLR